MTLLDPMFTKNTDGYKQRAAKQLQKNPTHFTDLASKGGSVTGIAKGFAAMSEQQRKQIQAKGVATRKASKAKREQ